LKKRKFWGTCLSFTAFGFQRNRPRSGPQEANENLLLAKAVKRWNKKEYLEKLE
jgi:hypothetical protein